MIIDKIENLKNYVGVNRHFSKVIEFLEANDLGTLENGKHEIDGPDCFVNIMDTKGKTKEEAVMETHRRMLDIQIPLDADETYGYTPTADLPEAEYNEAKDVTKYPGVQGESFITSGNDGCLLARRRTPALHRNGREYPQGCDKDCCRLTRSGSAYRTDFLHKRNLTS